jgi:hypothetical protein
VATVTATYNVSLKRNILLANVFEKNSKGIQEYRKTGDGGRGERERERERERANEDHVHRESVIEIKLFIT